MKNKQPLKKSRIFISAVVLLVVAAGGGIAYSLFSHQALADGLASTASFNFNGSKAPGWWAGDNINPDHSTQTPTSASKTPTARRIIAQGTREDPAGGCFVMYSYWANNSKDITQVLNEMVAPGDTGTTGSFALQPTNTASVTMKISAGDTSFELHQYEKTSPDTSEMSTGEEFGVLKAGTGYIDIRGYCKTADELSVTLPVFSAVSFEE